MIAATAASAGSRSRNVASSRSASCAPRPAPLPEHRPGATCLADGEARTAGRGERASPAPRGAVFGVAAALREDGVKLHGRLENLATAELATAELATAELATAELATAELATAER